MDLRTRELFRRDGFIKLGSRLEPEWVAALRTDARSKIQYSAAGGSKYVT